MNAMVNEFKSLPVLLQDVFQEMDDSARETMHPELCLSILPGAAIRISPRWAWSWPLAS
jgi:hypothetical protein